MLAAAATSGAGRPAGRARLASKPVIVAMTPELLAVAIDHPRRDCLGGRLLPANGSSGGPVTSTGGGVTSGCSFSEEMGPMFYSFAV